MVGRTPGKGQITPLERTAAAAVIAKWLRQGSLPPLVFPTAHRPGRSLIEPMDDTGAPLAANSRKTVAAIGDQGVHQCSGPVAGSRMNNQAGRLVDHDHIVIFVND